MTVEEQARDAQDSAALSWMARLGFAMYGVVYVVVGILAVQLALGRSSGKVSGEGALHELAHQPFGTALLVAAAAGLGAVTAWEVCEAIGGHTADDGARRWVARAGSVARAAVFAVLAWLAVRLILGEDCSSGGTEGHTARVMDLPFGPVIVTAAGLLVFAFGAHSAHEGLSDRWKKDLERGAGAGATGTLLTVTARAGHVARGVAFGMIGALLVWAAVTHDARRSAGLDQALRELRDTPAGPALLLAIAVGLGSYGVFNTAKAVVLRTRRP
ncbi:DUF1206 domain-containing protein [Nocardioides humilatus]|uniref:DUF1206 domain-containing protein n=1 Tax=Nocardioides humilatus TaxID=2607660 RepID=A0A5B1L5F2_9ACTN|nr:DUF1206 domain-containing protein [Nocardioides humilatus]KAA1415882.1 DUF1206 domain-containing protein [Nocardioides humilatus]